LQKDNFVRSKIICTIGPASKNSEIPSAIIENDIDIARLYFSHDKYSENTEMIKTLKEIEGVSILIALPEPKIRIGEINGRVGLSHGDEVHFNINPIVARAV